MPVDTTTDRKSAERPRVVWPAGGSENHVYMTGFRLRSLLRHAPAAASPSGQPEEESAKRYQVTDLPYLLS
ncbi:hypothetical protein RRG08_023798 [Elysia crispata]|uniref:Uncharacterized protein n=1 Tax=Elysia crispata TaxID=231223 RepID=A0AAE1DMQ5_9GAST|nr:hypothetical protein RRG08_023798 [Elysia crispata]